MTLALVMKFSSGRRSSCAHLVVAGIVRQLCHPEGLQQGRQVHPEPAAIAASEAVPPSDGVVGRAAPGLDSAFGGRLLLVRSTQRYPVRLLLQPFMEVGDGAQVVPERRRADL